MDDFIKGYLSCEKVCETYFNTLLYKDERIKEYFDFIGFDLGNVDKAVMSDVEDNKSADLSNATKETCIFANLQILLNKWMQANFEKTEKHDEKASFYDGYQFACDICEKWIYGLNDIAIDITDLDGIYFNDDAVFYFRLATNKFVTEAQDIRIYDKTEFLTQIPFETRLMLAIRETLSAYIFAECPTHK